MKLKLLPKFVASLGILGVILTVVISLFSYNNSKTYLEEMYAHRVVSGSLMVADMLDVEDVKAIIAENGNQSESYERICALFDKLKVDGDITYLSLAVPDEDSVTFYIDSCVPEMGDDPANQIPYGTDILYSDASSSEEEYQKYLHTYELFSENKGVDEPVVTDNEYGYNYSVAAVVLDENGKAIAEVQYNLDMGDVRAYLNSYLRNMFLISAVIVLVAMFIYILTVRRIVLKPIAELADFTDDITKTRNFEDRRIELKTGDEIEDLGNSFNFMMEEMERYIDDLSKVTAEKQRIGAELDIATRIQASMLPTIFPAFPDREEFDIYATMDPAKEVGGDFYDFFMVDDDHLAIVVADVSGKGVPAALFMVIGKTLIKDHTEKDKDLGEVFSEINNLLCESNSEELFITAFEGVLNIKTGEFRYVNAGHEMPFIYKKNEEFKPYKIKPGFVLAGMEDIRYRSGVMTLEPGDKIFQYTDGVTEATDSASQLFGMERLEASLNKVKDKEVTEILKSVKADIDEFVNVAPQFDDITMLCLEYKQYKK
ncbi:MAG: SpoIIE family protein phosphatase [Solobacterium sp.]|nr:SpoIIE family protein phosphatase [Solobacterium sp.]